MTENVGGEAVADSGSGEASAPQNLDSAFDSAFETGGAEGAAEEQGEAVAEPAQAAAAEPEVADADDAVLQLSPQELQAIKSNPATAKLYKSLMKASTAKFQEIAANKRILDAYQRDPEGTIKALAQHHGIQIAEQKRTQASEAVDEVTTKMVELFGPQAAQALKPLFEQLAQSVVAREVAPLKEQQEMLRVLGAAKQAEAVTGGFRAKHSDINPEVEAKMVQIGQRIQPSQDMTPDEYLETLYILATAGQVKAATSKEVVERMKKAAGAAEPRRSMPSDQVKSSSSVRRGMTLDQAFDAAFEEASR